MCCPIKNLLADSASGALESYIVERVIWSLINFPRVGAFDHLKWTYDGAFEWPFGRGGGIFEH